MPTKRMSAEAVVGVLLGLVQQVVPMTAPFRIAIWVCIALLSLDLVRRTTYSAWTKVITGVGVVIAVVAVAWSVWPKADVGLTTLTPAQRARFIEVLKGTANTTPVHLMCPPYSEQECVAAGQFVTIFREAGWTVKGDAVERIETGIPRSGLYFVLYSSIDKDLSKADAGVWVQMPAAYLAVAQAFSEVVPIGGPFDNNRLVNGTTFPKDELGIYFGQGVTTKP